jgi:hypothetical protein
MRSFGSISYLFSRKALSGLARPARKGWNLFHVLKLAIPTAEA